MVLLNSWHTYCTLAQCTRTFPLPCRMYCAVKGGSRSVFFVCVVVAVSVSSFHCCCYMSESIISGHGSFSVDEHPIGCSFLCCRVGLGLYPGELLALFGITGCIYTFNAGKRLKILQLDDLTSAADVVMLCITHLGYIYFCCFSHRLYASSKTNGPPPRG